jgi:hypothetical protein
MLRHKNKKTSTVYDITIYFICTSNYAELFLISRKKKEKSR